MFVLTLKLHNSITGAININNTRFFIYFHEYTYFHIIHIIVIYKLLHYIIKNTIYYRRLTIWGDENGWDVFSRARVRSAQDIWLYERIRPFCSESGSLSMSIGIYMRTVYYVNIWFIGEINVRIKTQRWWLLVAGEPLHREKACWISIECVRMLQYTSMPDGTSLPSFDNCIKTAFAQHYSIICGR